LWWPATHLVPEDFESALCFKAVTALSPLQFQKQLRLQEAHRLLLGEDLDVVTATYRVGYNDASHFNREYKSVFGDPPLRHIQGCGKKPILSLVNDPELAESHISRQACTLRHK
jgi:AraC-like DNA-binding protein